jgi:sugar phosphate isomerase/epimerase
MKTCVSSYSFHKYITTGRMTQLDTVKAAKELGFDAIEFADIMPHDGSAPEDYARRLRDEAAEREMPIANFVFGGDLINGTGGRTPEEEIAHIKRMVDIGQILGVPTVRHDVVYAMGGYDSFDDLLPLLAHRVREIAEYARTKHIKTCVENHGFICQDPHRLVALFKAVDCDNFGLLCDIGNFLCVDAEPAPSVAMVAPFAAFVHAKDFYVRSKHAAAPGAGFLVTRDGNYLKGTVVGHGHVPVRECLHILKNAGYHGYVSIEFEGMEDPSEALSIGLDNLKRLM